MEYRSKEDYLRTIYSFVEKNKDKQVKSVDIAESLNISKAAVSKMLKKLQNEKFVIIKPYSTVSLSKQGFLVAQKTTYKHRIVEVFLKDILKVKKSKVCDEAHILEHAFSDDIIKKLARFLQNPKICPHGKIIPKFD